MKCQLDGILKSQDMVSDDGRRYAMISVSSKINEKKNILFQRICPWTRWWCSICDGHFSLTNNEWRRGCRVSWETWREKKKMR